MKKLSKKYNVVIVRQWILDGAGPARYGYGLVQTCKVAWLGRTLAAATRALGQLYDDLIERDRRERDTVRR